MSWEEKWEQLQRKKQQACIEGLGVKKGNNLRVKLKMKSMGRVKRQG